MGARPSGSFESNLNTRAVGGTGNMFASKTSHTIVTLLLTVIFLLATGATALPCDGSKTTTPDNSSNK